MQSLRLFAILTLLCALTCAFAAEPWQQLYTGAEATGPNTIALWQFQPGKEAQDVSGHGHDLTARGAARFVTEGPLGGALESFGANSENDKEQGAIAKDADDLSPDGAFTLEAWFMLKPDADKWDSIYLFDKKNYPYAKDIPQANWDYNLWMVKAGGNRRLMASLGFGKDSAFLTGPQLDLAPGTWTHVAFTYDGAGRCRFFVDGKLASRVFLEGRGAIANGSNGLVIGDRFGSTHAGFPGYLAQVRVSRGIVPYFSGGLVVGLGGGRTAFVRMEKGVNLSLQVVNDSTFPVTGGKVQVLMGGTTRSVTLPDLAPNQETAIPLVVDTAVRPGTYSIKAIVSAVSNGQPVRVEKEIPLAIVARRLPNQMPVVMWGGGDIESLKRIGFTHELIGLVSEDLVWKAGAPVPAMSPEAVEQQGKVLDDLLKNGLNGAVSAHPGTWVTGDPERRAKYNRVDRTGAVRANENVCGNFPEVRQFCYNVGASIAQTFGQYPALTGALIHSEVRDASELCFHEHDKAAFKQFSGFDIPDEAVGKGGVSYRSIKGFPANRVIPDDYKLLTFYRWLALEGRRWLEPPAHATVPRPQVHRPQGSLDLLRSRRPRAGHLGQRGRRGLRFAVDLLLSRPDQDRSGDRRAVRHGRWQARPAGHEDDPGDLVPFADRAQAAGERSRPQAVGEGPAHRRVHHDRPRSHARGLLVEDVTAHPRHHVPRLAVAG